MTHCVSIHPSTPPEKVAVYPVELVSYAEVNLEPALAAYLVA